MNNLNVRLITPEGVLYEGEALEVYFPSAKGPLGILRGHAPLIAALDEKGMIRVKKVDGSYLYFVAFGGAIDVEQDSLLCIIRKGYAVSSPEQAKAELK